jgi:hypothetical protein
MLDGRVYSTDPHGYEIEAVLVIWPAMPQLPHASYPGDVALLSPAHCLEPASTYT